MNNGTPIYIDEDGEIVFSLSYRVVNEGYCRSLRIMGKVIDCPRPRELRDSRGVVGAGHHPQGNIFTKAYYYFDGNGRYCLHGGMLTHEKEYFARLPEKVKLDEDGAMKVYVPHHHYIKPLKIKM